MKVITKTDEYTIYQKRNERHAVKASSGAWINGDEKVAVLLEHKLIEAPAPKAPEPEPEPEVAAEASAEEADTEAAEPDDTAAAAAEEEPAK